MSDHRHRLGPHRPPRIECGKCGEEHHYDHALREDGMPGICPTCSAFLREPTEAEHEQFTAFLAWNTKHQERDRAT